MGDLDRAAGTAKDGAALCLLARPASSDFIDGKRLSEIDGRLIAEIIRARTADGVSNATIKRDLVALSSVINYAIDQGWLESNPVLRPHEADRGTARAPSPCPAPRTSILVIERAPGMIKDLIRAAMATGARQDELLQRPPRRHRPPARGN